MVEAMAEAMVDKTVKNERGDEVVKNTIQVSVKRRPSTVKTKTKKTKTRTGRAHTHTSVFVALHTGSRTRTGQW